MTVGLILFWPALFGLAATRDRKDDLGRLKGEYEAVELQGRKKQCTLPAPPPSAPASPPAAKPTEAGVEPPKYTNQPPMTPVTAPAPANSNKAGFTECRQEGNKILCR